MPRPVTSRSNSQGRVLVKSSRPSALKLNKLSHKKSPSSSSAKRNSQVSFEDEVDDMGLPNFCTTCEKQIVTPNPHLLYCSEACRRRDGSRPASAVFEIGLPSSPAANHDASSFPDIVPQRSPTMVRPPSGTSINELNELSHSRRQNSDASVYLSQFLHSGTSIGSPRRSVYRNATTSSSTTLPSLSHTPSSLVSPSSSFGSAARTAPSRPTFQSQRAISSRSFDLVVPLAAPSTSKPEDKTALRSSAGTSTAFRAVEGEFTYEKRKLSSPSATGCSAGQGSLKQLFAHERMAGSRSSSGSSVEQLGERLAGL